MARKRQGSQGKSGMPLCSSWRATGRVSQPYRKSECNSLHKIIEKMTIERISAHELVQPSF